MENLIEQYEEIYDFMQDLQKKIDDIPDFEESYWVNDYLVTAVDLCSAWLEKHEEEYYRLRSEEEIALNREYERSKL